LLREFFGKAQWPSLGPDGQVYRFFNTLKNMSFSGKTRDLSSFCKKPLAGYRRHPKIDHYRRR